MFYQGGGKVMQVAVLKEMLPPGISEMLDIDYDPKKKKNTADTKE